MISQYMQQDDSLEDFMCCQIILDGIIKIVYVVGIGLGVIVMVEMLGISLYVVWFVCWVCDVGLMVYMLLLFGCDGVVFEVEVGVEVFCYVCVSVEFCVFVVNQLSFVM